MKKYIVIGNPIEHSLSPLLHNYWIKKNNISAEYDKKKLNTSDLKSLVDQIRDKKLNGVNVTVPFKKEIISYMDKLSPEAKSTQSVNTIYLDEDTIIGHNTDIAGFEHALRDIRFNVKGKKVFILGAGGVVPSIIFALKKMKVNDITLSNRTRKKAENIKELFKNLKVLDWGNLPDFDMIINATSLGLNFSDKIELDFSKLEKNKFFFDIIYNPAETNFLKNAKKSGNLTANGKRMFIYQAYEAFKLWHGVNPVIDEEIYKLLDK